MPKNLPERWRVAEGSVMFSLIVYCHRTMAPERLTNNCLRRVLVANAILMLIPEGSQFSHTSSRCAASKRWNERRSGSAAERVSARTANYVERESP
jgi:hypothetical protein